VGEAKAESGHVSPGHLVTGTATDIYSRENTAAGWDRLEQGLAVLAKAGFEVGYDGSVPGTQAWSGHGRGNHAHIEWVGQGSSTDAIKRLSGMNNRQIAAFEAEAGMGGGAFGSGGYGGGLSGGGGALSSYLAGPGSTQAQAPNTMQLLGLIQNRNIPGIFQQFASGQPLDQAAQGAEASPYTDLSPAAYFATLSGVRRRRRSGATTRQ